MNQGVKSSVINDEPQTTTKINDGGGGGGGGGSSGNDIDGADNPKPFLSYLKSLFESMDLANFIFLLVIGLILFLDPENSKREVLIGLILLIVELATTHYN